MEDGKDPKDSCEGHGTEDEDLYLVLCVEVLDVFEEFGKHGEPYELAFGNEVGLDYGGEGEGIDDDTRAFGEDDADPAWRSISTLSHASWGERIHTNL